MARARNIKPGFFKNEELAECSAWARLCFAGLWTLADREGRLEDRPKRIKGELFAFDSVEVDPLLDELAAHGFILRYQAEHIAAIQILGFNTHQTPHYSEKSSVIKAPPFPEHSRSRPSINGSSLREHSEKPPPIKRGSQPPDSLIPDSPNPDSLNPSPPRASARGAAASLDSSRRGKEPAWRADERRRIAAVAPAAVSGDVGEVFAPLDEARHGG